ncbi:uncharacterized protein [Onthophagus taurus]|uniref:uncharacterized protein n=1 Tax=Onthophagus taurus TaxID=166361 RepID=UPI0039BDB5D4
MAIHPSSYTTFRRSLAAVKSAKYHLKRIVQNARLTYESFYALLVQIESILNSRPLCPLSQDPYDLQALRPGHFLIGESLTTLPQRNVTEIPTNTLNNFQQLQQMCQNFWKKWSSEYLHTVQQRNKWRIDVPEGIRIGDLVLLKEDNTPPLLWPLGLVTELHPGNDGAIRVVSVRTNRGEVKRGVKKVCFLPKSE